VVEKKRKTSRESERGGGQFLEVKKKQVGLESRVKVMGKGKPLSKGQVLGGGDLFTGGLVKKKKVVKIGKKGAALGCHSGVGTNWKVDRDQKIPEMGKTCTEKDAQIEGGAGGAFVGG